MICSSGCEAKRRCARTRTAPIGFWLQQSWSGRPLRMAQCAGDTRLGETHPSISRPLEEARPKGCAARARFRAGLARGRARRRDSRRYEGAQCAPLGVRATASPGSGLARARQCRFDAFASFSLRAFARVFPFTRPRHSARGSVSSRHPTGRRDTARLPAAERALFEPAPGWGCVLAQSSVACTLSQSKRSCAQLCYDQHPMGAARVRAQRRFLSQPDEQIIRRPLTTPSPSSQRAGAKQHPPSGRRLTAEGVRAYAR
jgi:hypothetical protein